VTEVDDEVASRRKPLDVARVVAAASPLHVLATDVDTQAAVMFDGFRDAADLLAALRASATMPVVAGGPAVYRGRRLLDASLTEPIPLAAAEAGGHTHVLVLRTRDGAMRARPSAFDRHFVGPRLRRLSPALAERYLDRARPYGEIVRSIAAGRGPGGRAEVHAISVANLHVGKLERDAGRLRAAAARARQAVLDVFAR
jgi:predicted patatin/cPLA2 family phospholipase